MVLAEEVHSRQSRGVSGRQAVIRRLNSRSSRSVFVRVNLHQVSIFRAFRYEARRGEAKRDEVMWCERRERQRRLRSKGQKAPSPWRWSIIHQRITVRISGMAGRTLGQLKITLRDISPTLENTSMKFSYELAYRENEYQLVRDSFIFQWHVLIIN